MKLSWPPTILLVPLRKTGSGESILLMQAGREAAGFLEGPPVYDDWSIHEYITHVNQFGINY